MLPPMSTVLLPMNVVLEVPPEPAGADDDGSVPTGVRLGRLVATVLPVAVGVLGAVVGLGVPVPPPLPMVPTGTSCHCWLAPPWSRNWSTPPPLAVEALRTSTAMPLKRLTRRS